MNRKDIEMKAGIFIIFILFILASCQTDKERTDGKLSLAIKKAFEDAAFKQDEKLNFITITNLNYKKISKEDINRIFFLYKEKNRLKMKLDASTQLLETNGYRLNTNMSKNEMKAMDYLINNAKQDTDSLQNILELIKKTENELGNNNTGSTDFFAVKFHCKASIGNNNILDTLKMYFDKNYILMDLGSN